MTGLLTAASLLAMPAVNVLGFNVATTPAALTGLLLFLWLAVRGALKLDSTYFALLGLAICCFIPLLSSANYISSKSALHALALLASISIFYAGMRGGLQDLIGSGRSLLIVKLTYVALLATSAFILAEFVAANLLHIKIASLVPYVDVTNYDTLIFGVVRRPRGFATEPGVMALYYDFALFFVLPVLRRGWRWRLPYLLCIIPAYLLLFSVASWLGCGIAFALLTVRRLQVQFFSTTGRLLLTSAVLAAALMIAGSLIKIGFESTVLTRAQTFVGDSGGRRDVSASERLSTFQEVGRVLGSHPFGIGFGITAGLEDVGGLYEGMALSTGQISLLGTFGVAGGIPAILLLVTIIVHALWRALQVPKYGLYIAAGGFAISVHEVFVTEYWLPFFWFFLALAGAFGPIPHYRDESSLAAPFRVRRM
jgi:hypothetical protein